MSHSTSLFNRHVAGPGLRSLKIIKSTTIAESNKSVSAVESRPKPPKSRTTRKRSRKTTTTRGQISARSQSSKTPKPARKPKPVGDLIMCRFEHFPLDSAPLTMPCLGSGMTPERNRSRSESGMCSRAKRLGLPKRSRSQNDWTLL